MSEAQETSSLAAQTTYEQGGEEGEFGYNWRCLDDWIRRQSFTIKRILSFPTDTIYVLCVTNRKQLRNIKWKEEYTLYFFYYHFCINNLMCGVCLYSGLMNRHFIKPHFPAVTATTLSSCVSTIFFGSKEIFPHIFFPNYCKLNLLRG